MDVKILDCTLRDGGYVNMWDFGERNIQQLVNNLTESGVDFIELGFLRSIDYDPNKTLFDTVQQMSRFIPKCGRGKARYLGMITHGEVECAHIPVRDNNLVDGFRVIFKKPRWREALKDCAGLKAKGYTLFVNPMHTYSYSEKELLDLINAVNEIDPYAMSIVDTLGIMDCRQVSHVFDIIDAQLNAQIGVCFHSHNNLQLSFSNAQELLSKKTERIMIVDSSIRGMGRGAGNLCTELLLHYLNSRSGKKYNLIPILRSMDEQIQKIYLMKPWGYTVPYYLAASMKCHPNYASFLTDKGTVSVESINDILSLIPEEKKSNFDQALITDLYLKYQKHEVNDKAVVRKLSIDIGTHSVLVIASGGSIVRYKKEILSYIKDMNPYVISLNFRPTDIEVNKVFISNSRRYAERDVGSDIIVTSNVKTSGIDTVNYGSYLNNSEMPDNCALMLLKLLISIGIRDVTLAGMDGFSRAGDDYCDVDMVSNARLGEFDRRNEIMKEALRRFSAKINIHFLTPSLYE